MKEQYKQTNKIKRNKWFNLLKQMALSGALFLSFSTNAQTKLDQDIARAVTNIYPIEQNAVANVVYKTTAELGALEQNDGGSSFFLMTLPQDKNQIFALSIEFTVFGSEKSALQGLKDELRHYAADTSQLRRLYNFEVPGTLEHRNVFLIVWNGTICEIQLDRIKGMTPNEQVPYLEKFESIRNALLLAAPGALWFEIDNKGQMHWNNPTVKYSVN
jgi:hypothetical protein